MTALHPPTTRRSTVGGIAFPLRFPVRGVEGRTLRYRTAKALFRAGLKVVYGRGLLDVRGTENIPVDGPLLVVSNHLSLIDPVLHGALFPRSLFAMAKKEIFPNRVAAWFWAGCNTFPVDRHGQSRSALRIARGILADGGRLLMFIEGTRALSPGMIRAESGAALLVRQSGCAILPAAVWGTERAWPRGGRRPRRASMHLRYGRPFRVPSELLAGGDRRAVSDFIAAQVAAMLPEAYRGYYAIPAEEAA